MKEHFNLCVEHIPGGLTPVAQMLDQTPNRIFKQEIHDSYNEWALTQPTDEHCRMKPPSRSQLMRWAVEAWTKVTPRMIVRASVLTGGSRVCDIPSSQMFVCVKLCDIPT